MMHANINDTNNDMLFDNKSQHAEFKIQRICTVCHTLHFPSLNKLCNIDID